jgi:hypothetical protein
VNPDELASLERAAFRETERGVRWCRWNQEWRVVGRKGNEYKPRPFQMVVQEQLLAKMGKAGCSARTTGKTKSTKATHEPAKKAKKIYLCLLDN